MAEVTCECVSGQRSWSKIIRFRTFASVKSWLPRSGSFVVGVWFRAVCKFCFAGLHSYLSKVPPQKLLNALGNSRRPEFSLPSLWYNWYCAFGRPFAVCNDGLAMVKSWRLVTLLLSLWRGWNFGLSRVSGGAFQWLYRINRSVFSRAMPVTHFSLIEFTCALKNRRCARSSPQKRNCL